MGRRRHPPPGTPDGVEAGTVSPVDVDTLAFTTVAGPEVSRRVNAATVHNNGGAAGSSLTLRPAALARPTN